MCLACITLHASILPTVHLEPAALKAFQDYVARFENSVAVRFYSSGKMWIDESGKRAQFEQGKPVVEQRQSGEVANGTASIHHFSGAIRVNGATIENIRRVMQDYGNYPKYFKPDIGQGSGTLQPDSNPADEHYRTHLTLTQSTAWMNVIYDSLYDTHYRRVGPGLWTSKSTSLNLKELKDAKDPSQGTYPEGDDHGFLWRTNTYWFVRERDGGLDLEADSMTLSRPVPLGMGWWGTKRTRDAVDKMLRDTKAAIEGLH